MISRGQAGLLRYIVLTCPRMEGGGGGAGEGREEGGGVEWNDGREEGEEEKVKSKKILTNSR